MALTETGMPWTSAHMELQHGAAHTLKSPELMWPDLPAGYLQVTGRQSSGGRRPPTAVSPSQNITEFGTEHINLSLNSLSSSKLKPN